MFKKCILILAASCMMYSCGTKTESNPFFTEFQTEYGVPSFDKIKLEHYEPAFLKGIEEQNQNIHNVDVTFGQLRDRVLEMNAYAEENQAAVETIVVATEAYKDYVNDIIEDTKHIQELSASMLDVPTDF